MESCNPELLRPATMTEEDLRRSAIWRRKAMLARVHVSDPAHVEHLLETAEEKLSLGFLEAHSSVKLRSRSSLGEMTGR